MGRYSTQDGAIDSDDEEPDFDTDAVESCGMSVDPANHTISQVWERSFGEGQSQSVFILAGKLCFKAF